MKLKFYIKYHKHFIFLLLVSLICYYIFKKSKLYEGKKNKGGGVNINNQIDKVKKETVSAAEKTQQVTPSVVNTIATSQATASIANTVSTSPLYADTAATSRKLDFDKLIKPINDMFDSMINIKKKIDLLISK